MFVISRLTGNNYKRNIYNLQIDKMLSNYKTWEVLTPQ